MAFVSHRNMYDQLSSFLSWSGNQFGLPPQILTWSGWLEGREARREVWDRKRFTDLDLDVCCWNPALTPCLDESSRGNSSAIRARSCGVLRRLPAINTTLNIWHVNSLTSSRYTLHYISKYLQMYSKGRCGFGCPTSFNPMLL